MLDEIPETKQPDENLFSEINNVLTNKYKSRVSFQSLGRNNDFDKSLVKPKKKTSLNLK